MSADEFVGITPEYFWTFQVVLPYTTGLPEDVAINTWHFCGAGATDHTLAAGWLGAFYDSVGPRLSSAISRTTNAVTYNVYDLSRPKPNPPIAVYNDTIPAKTTNYVNMPGEVSLVGSYQAAPRAGYVQARRRGRVYLGPVAEDPSLTSVANPSSALVSALVAAMDTLWDSSEASSLCRWMQFSPTNAGGWMIPGQSGPPNLDAGASPIDNGWVDNEWDTQRRRQTAATSRTVFP
jgi:hypothetical protein